MSRPSAADAELGESNDSLVAANRFRTTYALCNRWLLKFFHRSQTCEMRAIQIEDYPQGYPRFSALIAASGSFHICRRFSNIRTRLLLLKQDKLSLLEKQLEKIDQEETAILFLGKSRCDSNNERIQVLSQIDSALADYDAMVERNNKMLTYMPASSRDVLSLQNWVNGNACLARDETAYLTHCNELISVTSSGDGTPKRLEAWIEDKLVYLRRVFRKGPRDISRDPNVYLFSGSFVAKAARALIASFLIFFLLAPAIICNSINGLAHRTIVVVVATILLVAALSCLIKAKVLEMFVAGTTYATVLVVFISGTNLIIN